jgi:hypothetical protein
MRTVKNNTTQDHNEADRNLAFVKAILEILAYSPDPHTFSPETINAIAGAAGEAVERLEAYLSHSPKEAADNG